MADELAGMDHTLEKRLSQMYGPETHLNLPPFFSRTPSQPYFLRSGKVLSPELVASEALKDGYIFGVGNSGIWSALCFFAQDTPPKGIISISINPAIVLSGRLLVDLAKRGVSAEEAIAYFYDGTITSPTSGKPISYRVRHILQDASRIAAQEPNRTLRYLFMAEVQGDNFTEQLLDLHEMKQDYKADPLQTNDYINVPSLLYHFWDRIVAMARDGKIHFGYGDIKDMDLLDKIAKAVPDITSAGVNNVLYCSSVVDDLPQKYPPEGHHLEELRPFNGSGNSIFIATPSSEIRNLAVLSSPPVLRGNGNSAA